MSGGAVDADERSDPLGLRGGGVPRAVAGTALAARRGAVSRVVAAWERDRDQRQADAAVVTYQDPGLDSILLRVKRPLERDPEDRENLFVSLLVRATNTAATPESARLALAFERPDSSLTYGSPDSLVRTPWEHGWGASREADSTLGWCPDPEPGRVYRRSFRLPPRGEDQVRVLLPAYPTPERELRVEARVSHDQRARRARAYWRGEVERGTRFELPDPDVCDAIRASRVILLSLRERRGMDWVPLGGPFHYRDVWLRDGARAMQALAISGYTEEARQMAGAFLRFQWPHGPFVSQTGQLDGTGQALWAFEQVLLRPAPPRDLSRFATASVKAWESLERQRTMARAPGGGAIRGLLPATDPRDNELIHAQIVGNDAWALAGYRATARLLEAAGMEAEAKRVERSRADYLRTFRDALARMPHTDVPPAWQPGGIDWGNLNVAYPCEVLPADDPRLEHLARRYWAPSGGAGLGYYRNPDSLHSYVAADRGTWALLAGRPEVADSVLTALLFWRSASGGAAEIFTRSARDFGPNYPPHPTAAAALLALIRNALVFDDADTLALTLGARDAWWTGSSVRRAPTRFGNVSLSFARSGGFAEWRWTAVPVWTSLTLPRGYRVEGTLPAGFRTGPRPSMVLAPPHTTRARIAIVPDVGAAGVATAAARD